MNAITKTFDLGDGREISIETGKLAKQSDGAVVVKCGNTMLLATIVSDKDAADGVDFLPLTVDYKEKYAGAGRFPGGFFKREARPTENEILTCRLVDRALRPLFPDDYHASTQCLIYMISLDENVPPDALAGLAASACIAVSDIPFNGPVSEVRVGRIDGKFILNPSYEQLEQSDMEMMVAATMSDIMMMEGEMKQISEAEMLEAIKFAHDAIKVQIQAQLDLAAEVGVTKREYSHETHDDDMKKAIMDATYEKAYAVASEGIADKHLRSSKFKEIKEEYAATLSEEEMDEKGFLVGQYYYKAQKEATRNAVLKTRKRLDGRALDEIRPIWSEVNYLPGAHGSAVFTRGETQSLTSVTLGTRLDEQMIDGAVISGSEKFMLHYNFPPFSTGEARPMRGTSRREVGHGNLALRALKEVIPTGADNPYTIRVVSEILESNGSSSMATVCAGTLALMDAGINISKPVSGIAMGLITNDAGEYAILSDILGDEDHLGDMDFKVCGTEEGITACQMDIKVDGLPYSVLEEALEQARQGRLHILGEMKKTMSAPADDMKPHAPRIHQMSIPKDLIGALIGPGGKVIQEIQKTTNSTITVEEVEEQGIEQIAATHKDDMDAALGKVKAICTVPEVGETYDATVKAIQPYGAFVEFVPGKEGLLHISEIAHERIENMDGVLNVGDNVKVKLLAVDPVSGKFKLSRKALLPKPENADN